MSYITQRDIENFKNLLTEEQAEYSAILPALDVVETMIYDEILAKQMVAEDMKKFYN